MKRNPKIEAICLYCEKAVISENENGEPTISCKRKKGIGFSDSCFRFRYDPLKEKPAQKLSVPTLDPDSVIT